MIDRLRVFDPLKKPKESRYDLVFHIPVCLDNIPRREDNADRDFNSLRFQIENFKKIKQSENPNFKMILCVSINGFLSSAGYIDYLKSIQGKLTDNINVVVFQRPNIGWQWGGLHDVWMRYKNTSSVFGTCECDVYFREYNWYDKVLQNLISSKKIGFVGQLPGNHTLPNINAYKNFKIPKRVWRDKNNKIIENPTKPMSKHSRGGWYICKEELLKSMDDAYGCFTFSMSHDNALDGIILGEVGFSHKTNQLGFQWICIGIADVFEKGEI